MRIKVRADHVNEGDYLPGMNDGYVFTDPVPADEVMAFTSMGQNIMPGPGMTMIYFHDEQGDECYLILPDDYEIKVARPRENPNA